MSRIVKHPGLYTITFPEGSTLKHCQKRTYGPNWRGEVSGCEWYVFRGAQFHKERLISYGCKIELEK